jgi:hypothetical protein
MERMGMKKLIFIGALLFAATGVQAQGTGSSPNSHPVQASTTLGPAGAGVYRNGSYSATDNVKPNTGAVGTRKSAVLNATGRGPQPAPFWKE